MSTIVSARKDVSGSYGKRQENQWIGASVIGLIAGVLLLIVGAKTNFNPALMLGFLSSSISFMYLNGMFWARHYEKLGKSVPKLSQRHYLHYQ